MKVIIKLLTFNLAIAILIFSLFEIVLSVKGFHFDPYKYYRRFGSNIEAEEIQYYEKDKELFWRFRPSQLIKTWWVPEAKINSMGLRGDEFEPENMREKMSYILCMGDSGIFGWSVEDDKTLPYILEKELRNKFKMDKIRVINAGVGGYSSYQGLIFMKRILKYIKPRIILFCFGRNDHNPTVFITDKERQHMPSTIVFLQNALLKTKVGQWIYMKTTLYLYKKDRMKFLCGQEGKQETKRVPIEDFKENLLEATRISKDNGAMLFLIPRTQEAEYASIMEEISKKYTHVKFIDLKPYTSDKQVLSFSEGEHEGYDRVAHIVVNCIDTEHIF